MTKDEAIAAIEHSLGIHRAWIRYIAGGHATLECVKEVGDIDHHRQCVVKYEGVLGYLRST